MGFQKPSTRDIMEPVRQVLKIRLIHIVTESVSQNVEVGTLKTLSMLMTPEFINSSQTHISICQLDITAFMSFRIDAAPKPS